MQARPTRGSRSLRVARVTAVGVAGGVLAITPVWLANALTQHASAASANQVSVQINTCPNLYCFEPGSVSGNTGDAVTWLNNTGATHNITRCDPSACSGQGAGTGGDTLASSNLSGAGTSYTHTFTTGGTYFYYCSIHGYNVMHGEVTVSVAPTPTPAPTPPPTPVPTPRPTQRPVATPAPTAMAAERTATAAPTVAPAVATTFAPSPSPSPLAAILPTFGSSASASGSAASGVKGVTTGAIAAGSFVPVLPLILGVLIIGGLAGVGYRLRRRRPPAA